MQSHSFATYIVIFSVNLSVAPAIGAEKGGHKHAVLHGEVTNDKGEPLAAAIVRVSPSGGDMRMIRGYDGDAVETKADDNGKWTIKVPLAKKAEVTVDALQAGYQSAAGAFRSGLPGLRTTLVPGETRELTIRLRPGLDVCGVVVDGEGKPVFDADVRARVIGADWYGDIAATPTDAAGRFRIYDFSTTTTPGVRGEIAVSHRDFVPSIVEDIYRLEPARRAELRIVLHPGRTLMGMLRTSRSAPAAGVLVELMYDDHHFRRCAMTDEDGRFKVTHLADGRATIRTHDLNHREKVERELRVDGDLKGVELEMVEAPLPESLNATEFAGATLTSTTDELAEIFDVPPTGVLVLAAEEKGWIHDTGIQAGDLIFSLNSERVRTVKELLTKLAAVDGGHSVRISFLCRRVDFAGTKGRTFETTSEIQSQAKELVRSAK